MSEDKKIVSLADRRAERLAASQDAAFERGEVLWTGTKPPTL